MDESFDVLWAHVLDGWDDETRHEVLLAYCVEHGMLAEAAKKYRSIAEPSGEDSADVKDPADVKDSVDAKDSADAKKRLAAIAVLAMASLDGHATESPVEPIMTALRIFAAICLVVALVSLAFVLTT